MSPHEWVKTFDARYLDLVLGGIRNDDPRFAGVDKAVLTLQGFYEVTVDWTTSSSRVVRFEVNTTGATNITNNLADDDKTATVDVEFHATGGEAVSDDNLVLALRDTIETVDYPAGFTPTVVVQNNTAGGMSITDATLTTVATANITPRNVGTRIRVDVSCEAHSAAGGNNNMDLRMRASLYRGNTLLKTQTNGNDDSPRNDEWDLPFSFAFIDSPNANTEQTYTLRVQKLGSAAYTSSVSSRTLILTEVL